MLVRFVSLILLPAILCATAVHGAAIERGVAITDPLALRELDAHAQKANGHAGFGLGQMLSEAGTQPGKNSGADLFSRAALMPIRAAFDHEFDRYVAQRKATKPEETTGVGPSFAFQLFDRAVLYAETTRFVLAGIVNRMDLTYKSPDACGEVRLIYRPVSSAGPAGTNAAPTRLPMTLNLVLKARDDKAAAAGLSCATIAQRWLEIANLSLTGAELADKLISANGPLATVGPQSIDEIETNIQIGRTPAHPGDIEGKADYLLKVFNYDAKQKKFEEVPLDNQFDTERLLSDAKLSATFKQWLLKPAQLRELDRGTILVPDEFLATRGIVATPVETDGKAAVGTIVTDKDVVAALAQAARKGIVLENIRSPAGFQRRLNDVTCVGCHQTRAIGGFHFPGADWLDSASSSAVVASASPHFFGDQERRRDILATLRDGKAPDYSRGFSVRPQPRRSRELAGTTYTNGWGARCYAGGPGAAPIDKSFASWTCAEGLVCQVVPQGASSQAGLCFPKGQ